MEKRVQLLTPREMEVLTLLAEGWTNIYISKKLFIGDSTLRQHLIAIYRKLELSGSKSKAIQPRVAAVLIFYSNPRAIMNTFPESFEIQQWEYPNA